MTRAPWLSAASRRHRDRLWLMLALLPLLVACATAAPGAEASQQAELAALVTRAAAERAADAATRTRAAELLATDTPTPSVTPSTTPSPTATSTPSPTATHTETPTVTPVATLNPDGHVGLGAYLLGTPYDGLTAVERFEVLVRHKMTYVLWFQAWGDGDSRFHSDWVELAHTRGYIPVITWEPWSRRFGDPAAIQPDYALGRIAAGAHDAYLREWAVAARDVGGPIIIRFAHEQSTRPGERSWYPWQGDPEGYRAAFRRVVSVFDQMGAENVEFLWSAMWLNSWAHEYYPGNDVVDQVGTTVLNHGLGITADWAGWRTFDSLFQGQYEAAQAWGKPIMVTELGSAEQGGDKAQWLRDTFSSLETDYPLVSGVLLFEVESDREWPQVNWSVASSPDALAAFVDVTSDPYFR